jgi:hypothetical protein
LIFTEPSGERPRYVKGATVGALLCVALLASATSVLRAQANLSQQGLGFPTGQLSARALGTGGAVGEIDPVSQINPAALTFIGTTTLFFQVEPEYRSVVTGSATDKTTTARYPLFAGVVPLGSKWAFGISSATLLDRTWTTSTPGTLVTGNDTVTSTIVNGSNGSINDFRLAAAWAPTSFLRLGLAGHLISGSDRVFAGLSFADSAFSAFSDSTTLGFGGGAVSGGIELVAPKFAILSASYRKGGRISASRNDTTLNSARVPDRLGVSLAYVGAAGTQIAVRTSYDKWSSLNGLEPGGAIAVNAWDTSVGADFTGPRIGSQSFMLRLGERWRTLPFEVGPGNDKVREQSLSGGIGTAFGGGRVLTDVSLVHARRDAGIATTERAWTLSIGLGIRP